MVDSIVAYYNFESDNESHINAAELSDLSDEFEDDLNEESSSNLSQRSKELNHASQLSLDDIPYDRDLKWINVPTTARQQRPGPTVLNPNQNRILKQVNDITRANLRELKELDDHYRKLDERKKFSEEKFANSYRNRPHKQISSSSFDERGRRGLNPFPRNDSNAMEISSGEIFRQSEPSQERLPPFHGATNTYEKRDFSSQQLLHPLHHQHNHRSNAHRKTPGRFNDHQRPYQYSNKFAKNQTAQQHQHDVQVRQVRSEEYIAPHPLRDYYDHSAEFEMGNLQNRNSTTVGSPDEFINYPYQSPLGGYATSQPYQSQRHFQTSSREFSDSPYSAPVSANTAPTGGASNAEGGLNPFAQEFVPSFMLH